MTKQVVAILGICKIITILKMYKVTEIGREKNINSIWKQIEVNIHLSSLEAWRKKSRQWKEEG